MLTDKMIESLAIEVAKMIKKNLNEINSKIPANLSEKDKENLKLSNEVKIYVDSASNLPGNPVQTCHLFR